jgi:hypothetical protein
MFVVTAFTSNRPAAPVYIWQADCKSTQHDDDDGVKPSAVG